MDLTESYDRGLLPRRVLKRYYMREVRNATALLAATNPVEFDEVMAVLSGFVLTEADVLSPGGNKSQVAQRLDRAFRELGWREGRHDMSVTSVLEVMPYRPAGERRAVVRHSSVVSSEGYKVDNVKGRVALDVEWNAKDGNLDRDLAAYRALYDAAIIDVAVIVTRSQHSIRNRAVSLEPGTTKFNTTTTTTREKLEPRLTRGDAGGCPVVAFAVTASCMD